MRASSPITRTGLGRGHVVLADMDTVGTDGRGQVGPVVEDERHLVVGADPLDEGGPRDQQPVGQVLLAQLHDVDPALDAGVRRSARGRAGRACRGRAAGSVRATHRRCPGGRVPSSFRRRMALALALAFACCLNWRTLTRASGESMSATERNVPGLTVGSRRPSPIPGAAPRTACRAGR